MSSPFHIATFLTNALKNAAANTEGFDSSFEPDVRPADPRFGDFQANGILPLAKALKTNPRALASSLIETLNTGAYLPEGSCTWDIAGPGFINFKLSPAFLLEWVREHDSKESLQQGAKEFNSGKTIAVDYSSPNTAKQLHIGHIRSMVIGEAIQRLLKFSGAKVIRDNHIGDWGTQFGILIAIIKDKGYDLDGDHQDPLEDLEDLYREGSARFKDDEAFQAQARAELVRLQQGEAENLSVWKKITEVSYSAFEEIYKLLNIEFDSSLGESFYRDQVDRVYEELQKHGLVEESEGALVATHTNPENPKQTYPLMVRKSDGASNYVSTDLATVLHHAEQWDCDEIVYVTDGRQQDHFRYLYKTVNPWFEAMSYAKTPVCRHTWFGTILGEDGKAIKTRSGNPIKLKELLGEAVERAGKIVEEKNPGLGAEEKAHIARVVGMGAVRYADLSQNRTSDYVFNWDKLLAFDGNTAPYLLYAVARLHSIFRKAGMKPGEGEAGASAFETEQELTLARKLANFPLVIEQTLADLRPHILCTYLFELSTCFSSFYNANKVLLENEPEVQARRLMLCSRTLLILELGLHLLGLETLEAM